MLTVPQEYERKVREIALAQWRYATGADLETGRPDAAAAEKDPPRAA